MFNKKRILAVVMARGGSKGIKNKNLKKINLKSLVAISGQLLKKVKKIDESIISTDSKKIALEAEKNHLNFHFLRPKKISGDRVSDLKVINHSLKFMEKFRNQKFDIVLIIQPTSPMRKAKDIFNCIKIASKKNVTSCWTVNEVSLKFHPYKQLIIKNKRLKFFNKIGKKIIARQQLNKTFYRNGVCYAIRRNTILKEKNILGKNARPLILNKEVINIDNYKDLQAARKKFQFSG